MRGFPEHSPKQKEDQHILKKNENELWAWGHETPGKWPLIACLVFRQPHCVSQMADKLSDVSDKLCQNTPSSNPERRRKAARVFGGFLLADSRFPPMQMGVV